MAYSTSSSYYTPSGDLSRNILLSYSDSMGFIEGESPSSSDLDLHLVFSQSSPRSQAEELRSKCMPNSSEDDMVPQYPSIDLVDNHIDPQSTFDSHYNPSIVPDMMDGKKMQEELELEQSTISPQVIPIYSTCAQASEQTHFSPHLLAHPAVPGSYGAPSEIYDYRLDSSADASPSPFLYSCDAELATLPTGVSSPSISGHQESEVALPSNDCVVSSSPSTLSPPSSLRPTSPFLDITNFYSPPSEDTFGGFYEVMFAQPHFSPVIRASDSPDLEYYSLALTLPSPPQLLDAFAAGPMMAQSQNRQASTPERKKNLTKSICEHIDAPFSPFVLCTPERSLNSEPCTLSSPLSPLTPLTDDGRLALPSLKHSKRAAFGTSTSPSYGPSDQKKKRQALGSPTPSHATKRARSNSQVSSKGRQITISEMSSPERPLSTIVAKLPATSISGATQGGLVFDQRTFPRRPSEQDSGRKGARFGPIEISNDFPLFYRRFPASSYFKLQDDLSECALFKVPHPGGMYNRPRHAFDLYTPRFVKGKGKEKMGLCPICVESTERGGEGKKVWLAMKFSAYNYHMQYSHGISASSSLPFSPPVAFRTVRRPSAQKTEKTVIKEGKCHKCLKWVAVEGIKDIEVKVKELFWWKHAAACHSTSILEGETDVFEEDEVFKKLSELDAKMAV